MILLKYIATSVAFFLFYSFVVAQNLIPNPGFEEIDECPSGLKQFEKATYWQRANAGTPELFHQCGFTVNLLPHTGEGMAGVIFHSDYNNASLEYIQVELKDSLLPNQTYCLSYFIRLDKQSPIAINKIGAFFSKERLYTPNWRQFKNIPQIIVERVIDSKVTWERVEGLFKAKGGEKYITIGNFFEKHYLEEKRVGNNFSNWMSYYYLDDFSLVASDNCNLPKREIPPNKEEIIWSHIVYFEKDKHELTGTEISELHSFLQQLPKPLFQPIKVVGHTDTDASMEYNLQLSQKRAGEVESYLLTNGMNNVYLSWVGEEKTLNKELSEKEKALNRRVEITIIKNE